GRLAGSGIARQTDRGHRNSLALSPVQRSSLLQPFPLLLDTRNPVAYGAAIDLEAGFIGTSGTDPASQPGKGGSSAGQSGKQILELSQFDLKLPFPAPRALGKDVEDELSTVDHLHSQLVLQIAMLGWCQRIIEDHGVGIECHHRCPDLVELPLSNQECGIGSLSLLQETVNHLRACTLDQELQLFQQFVCFCAVAGIPVEPNHDPGFSFYS